MDAVAGQEVAYELYSTDQLILTCCAAASALFLCLCVRSCSGAVWRESQRTDLSMLCIHGAGVSSRE